MIIKACQLQPIRW